MIKGIIFDCFGVLIDNPYKRRLQELEARDSEKAQQVRDINRASDRGFLTNEEAAEHMAGLMGMTPEDFLAEQNEFETRNEELIPFVRTLRSKYKVALLSNVSSRERLEQRFEPGQLDELFDTVVASGDEGFIKPEPEIYEIAAERLGVARENCVMIDDIREFCDGAERVGMSAIQFTSTSQAIADLTTLIDRGEKTD